MNTQKIIALILIILLSSCVFLTENSLDQTISADNFLNRFPDNQKAIIIFKLSGQKFDQIYLCSKENIISNKINNCQSIYATNQYRILMLKPNLYYFFAPRENHPIFFNNKTEDQEKYLTILETKAGEMIYAGDIAYKQAGNDEEGKSSKILNRKFSINDNFDLVENILNGKNSGKSSWQKEKLFANQTWEINYLIKEYPSLKNRFKKRLLKSFEFKNPNLKNKKITQNA